MGLLDGLLGGAVGAALTNVVGDFIEKQGGVGGLVKQFQDKGLGGMVSSWVGSGPNEAMSADHAKQVFGEDTLKAMAEKVGVHPDELAQKLAEHLPGAVDKLTHDGAVPANG
jgi:uncharacterized protein YidB (DUF937 family)